MDKQRLLELAGIVTVNEMKHSEREAHVEQLIAPINAFLATIQDEDERFGIAGDIALAIGEANGLQMDIAGLTA